MRRFAAIDLMSDRIPNETIILANSFGEGFAYRHLLEKHELGEQIFRAS